MFGKIPRPSETSIRQLAASWQQQPHASFIRDIKQRSMLNHETLTVMHHLAGLAQGDILEIGSYIGGATATLARGKRSEAQVISVELGGSLDNPYLPSKDIISDWHTTIAMYAAGPDVHMIKGWSYEAHVIAEVRSRLGSRKVGMLIIDANGQPETDFANYRDLIDPNAFLVVDDYDTGSTNEKEEPVKAFVAGLVSTGTAKSLGVYSWGTWFGQLSI